jgi:pimeloyl-ACP methyl ester carboxylesterase
MTVTLVEPDPDVGFNYPYYLHVPERTEDGSRRILVEPTNTGRPSDEFDVHREVAENRVGGGSGRRIAERLSAPFLHPVFPRPTSDPVDWTHSVHDLDAETMRIDGGPLERVDLQLVAMVEDAREHLTERGWRIEERFALNGFSASATFATRFATLHPDRVSSVSAGGLNGMVTLPIPQIETTALEHADIATILGSETLTLDYPVGIADLAEITGEPFDLEAFRSVDRFLYMGGEDDRDSLLYSDAWTDTDLRAQAILTYGEDVHEDRFPRCEEIYDETGVNATFRTYEGLGHRPGPAEDDVVAFHERSLAGEGVESVRTDLG